MWSRSGPYGEACRDTRGGREREATAHQVNRTFKQDFRALNSPKRDVFQQRTKCGDGFLYLVLRCIEILFYFFTNSGPKFHLYNFAKLLVVICLVVKQLLPFK